MTEDKDKQEEVRYPVGEEGLTLGGQRNSFSDFELNLRVANIRKHLQYALEEIINLENLVYWRQMKSGQNSPAQFHLPDEEKE